MKIPFFKERGGDVITPLEILAMAGITSDQYRLREDGGYWWGQTSWGWSGESPDGMRRVKEDPTYAAQLAKKGEDGLWEIGSQGMTVAGLLEGVFVQPREWYAPKRIFAEPVLVEVGKGDLIPSIKEKIREKEEGAQDKFRAEVREFVTLLKQEGVYSLFPGDLQEKIGWEENAANDNGLPSFEWFREELEAQLEKAAELEPAIRSGEILVDFGGHFRAMGKTGQAQFWVIRPDGSVREPDEVKYRKRYTAEGEKRWLIVQAEELAISWFKACTAADHEFVVNKLPTGGVTLAQEETLRRLEQEIAGGFEGDISPCSGRRSPRIGRGWGVAVGEREEVCPVRPAEESSDVPSPPEGGWTVEDLKNKFNRRP